MHVLNTARPYTDILHSNPLTTILRDIIHPLAPVPTINLRHLLPGITVLHKHTNRIPPNKHIHQHNNRDRHEMDLMDHLLRKDDLDPHLELDEVEAANLPIYRGPPRRVAEVAK